MFLCSRSRSRSRSRYPYRFRSRFDIKSIACPHTLSIELICLSIVHRAGSKRKRIEYYIHTLVP